ncbi:MAG TPA: alpha-2-macroglobulin [Chthoniobacterales bacterium]|nr:alpha-2-macroglobulin [Chthoniobacterales bacterium]
MKTPAPLSKAFASIALAAAFLGRIPGQIFGNISWRPPRWLTRIGESWSRLERAYPRLIAPGVLTIFAVLCASAWTWHWYSHLPKPHRVTAKITPIEVTKLEKDLKFPRLAVYFSESAARLDDLKKPAVGGVELQPHLNGTWHWIKDDILVFEPTGDWPADQKFRVVFDKKFFPSQVRMERFTYETQTPAFGIAIKQVELYQDPTNPAQRTITANIELTHAVEPGELDRHLQFGTVSGSNLFASNDPAPHFKITYGLHQRVAFVQSSPIKLPEQDDFAKLMLSKGVRTSQGGAQSKNDLEQKVQIPSVASMFKIDSIETTVARNKNSEPEQLIVLTTTADISTRDLAKAMEVRLLPKRKVSEEEKEAEVDSSEDAEATPQPSASPNDETDSKEESVGSQLKETELWKSAEDVPDDVFDGAKVVAYVSQPSEKAQARQHAFRIRVETDGELYVRIKKGLRAAGDYPLSDDYNAVVEIPSLPREVQIEGQGGVLALNGEKKLSIRSRALSAIQFEISRVATAQINHLVSQTAGEFESPVFQNSDYFDKENISRIATERQNIAMENKWKANYSAFDFSQHLRKPADGGSERGLFFLTAQGYDPVQKKTIDIHDSRFILVTDIGILTKKNADGTHDVFLMSIKAGKPLANVTVDLLGKNGIPLQSAKTDPNGHCAFTSVEKSTHEKTPVAFVARNGDDVSFIAYGREDRQLNFSRFDIDGVDNVLPENLDAFVFTERGVYRPGDEIHIGMAVKQRNWSGNLKGLPLETEVVDARGHGVQTKKINLPDSAFTEFTYQSANESPTGLYTFNVYLVKNSKRSTLLGSTAANVKEFLPDRMKIDSRLSQASAHGWIQPKEMRATVSLANLYGTPATERRIVSKIELMPTAFSFSEFKDYTFFDPLYDPKKERTEQTIELGENKTDGAGQTQFDLQLERFSDATYRMRFIAEGFEAEGGRSVTTTTTALISALPYVIGCKADGDLRYIDMNKPRVVDLVAVDPQLNRIALGNVTANVIAQEYVSVLTKQESGKFAYESVLKERTTKSEKISVAATGAHYPLPTNEPGNYVFELRDDQDRRLAKVQFSVIGQGAVSRSLEKNSELQVKIDRAQYNSGDEIAISITAPYGGNGLITIERDRVYAQQWFQATSASSVQHIRVPENFEGSGYVNVAFVRALDSKEIFVSPLSYGVVPFTANKEKRRLKVDLNTVATAKPGEPLHISYKTDRPSKIIIFAVDKGILQVTNYKTPDPLEFYFRKCMLHVATAQIVDLIIPEFSLLRSVSAYGGGGDIQKLNPFKRVTDKPVVFWSGIVDSDQTQREVVYNVPDYFDGTLKIMAVAIANDTVGSGERESLIRGPFVITPSVPVLAAPGDEFETGVTVANNVEGSGQNAQVELRAQSNEQLSIVSGSTKTLSIAEGREQTAVFKFRANDKLGSGEITFVAKANGQETKRRATLSVRPPAPYMTEVHSGSFKDKIDIALTRDMHPEFRKLDATVSALPLGLARGLDSYLHDFPYGCSEQITSGAFCRLMLVNESDFGLSRAEVNKQLEHTFGILARRQNDQGAFGYWVPETGDHISFVSAYVMDFLSESKAAGFAPPPDMFASGLRYLQKMVGKQPEDLTDARRVAYAIYVLTREGVITTNYILNLRDWLDKNAKDEWQNDIAGVYLAGALHLLHKDSEAERLIDNYKFDDRKNSLRDDFFQPLGTNSQYIAVIAREFPAHLRKISAEQFQKMLKPIGDGEFNTLSSAYAVRALKGYSHAVAQNPPELAIAELHKDKSETRLINEVKALLRSELSGNASGVRFSSAQRLSGPGAFFQVVEVGFDRQVPNQALSNGLEVYREVLGKNNEATTRTKLGEQLHVRIHVRSLQREFLTNVAVVDLLPGGFEVVDSSIHTGTGATPGVDYVDVREDRAVFFVTAPTNALEIDYQIKSDNRGSFIVPPVFAQSMYQRNIKGRGVGGKITVTE